MKSLHVVALLGVALGPSAAAAACPDNFLVQVVGDFNAWDETAIPMEEISSCVFADTLIVEAQCAYMKFRTEFDWDATPDYGNCGQEDPTCQTVIPDDGTTYSAPTCQVTGAQAIGQLDFQVTGKYEFVLDLSGASATYSIRFLEATLPPGSLSGTVLPLGLFAVVWVFETGTGNLAEFAFADPFTGAFQAVGLSAGSYDLLIQAGGYSDGSVQGVVVVAGQKTDVGAITLVPFCKSITAVQVVGDFNGWDDSVAPMDEISNCVWSDTLAVGAGCHFMKFRTNFDWDETPDFGRCVFPEDNACQTPVPPDGSVLADDICLVSGVGSALGQLHFSMDGLYEFTVDGSAMMYSIRFLDAPVSVEEDSWARIKARYRD